MANGNDTGTSEGVIHEPYDQARPSSGDSDQSAPNPMQPPPADPTAALSDQTSGLAQPIAAEGLEISPILHKLSIRHEAGWDNSVLDEKQPEFAAAECEKIIKGDNNARIIFGRDRVHSKASGYGGKGHTMAGAIDIVVGLQGWNPAEGGSFDSSKNLKRLGKKDKLINSWIPNKADRNFGSLEVSKPGDAARIYISQRADIDDYFDICDGEVGRSVADSAIAMKADSVRIMSRKGIKIVTGIGPATRNAMGGKIDVVYGIDLIAGNRDFHTSRINQLIERAIASDGEVSEANNHYLQPIPKGYNLQEALNRLTSRIVRLNSIMAGVIKGISLITWPVKSPKFGISPTGPVSTIPTPMEIASVDAFSIFMQKAMADLRWGHNVLTRLEIDYLTPNGHRYINSGHNRTN